jgi:hypothetical protein
MPIDERERERETSRNEFWETHGATGHRVLKRERETHVGWASNCGRRYNNMQSPPPFPSLSLSLSLSSPSNHLSSFFHPENFFERYTTANTEKRRKKEQRNRQGEDENKERATRMAQPI